MCSLSIWETVTHPPPPSPSVCSQKKHYSGAKIEARPLWRLFKLGVLNLSVLATTKHLYNICTAPAKRLRRCANIVQMLYKCFMFAGLFSISSQLRAPSDYRFLLLEGGGPGVVISTAAFHARVRGFVSRSRRFERNKNVSSLPLSIVGSLRDREVACSASDRQGSNFESCVWRALSSHSSHHPQEVLMTQFSLYVHKSGLYKARFISFSSPRITNKNIFFILPICHPPNCSQTIGNFSVDNKLTSSLLSPSLSFWDDSTWWITNLPTDCLVYDKSITHHIALTVLHNIIDIATPN